MPNLSKNVSTFWTNPKVGWLFIAIFCLVKLSIHLYANSHYGFHRDELLHLAVGDHLAWGYMEFPPLIGWMGKLERLLFGESLLAVRLFPAIIGTLMVFLTGLIIREMKGKTLAILIGGISFLAVYSYYRNHTLFQPVAFDQLFWLLSFYFLIRLINTQQNKYLYFFALSAGLGVLNKYSMLVYLSGILVAILSTENRKWLGLKHFWLAVALGLFLILPNLIWQIQHDFPVLDHFAELSRRQAIEANRMDFILGQIGGINPFNFPIWMIGLLVLLFSKSHKAYRLFGFAYLFIGLFFLVNNGKHYYFFGFYPILFASGAVWLEQQIKGNWKYLALIYLAFLLYTGIMRIPYGTPFLPIEEFVEYAKLERNEEGYLEGLTGDYADMFGWPEQVALIDSVYQSLSEAEQNACLIWAENYGEAGALQHFGKKYGLPAPVSKHGSFWLWPPDPNKGEVVISIGNETDDVEYFFEEVQLIKRIKHPYAIEEEQNIPLYLCRRPKIKLSDYWPEWRDNIFD